MNQAEIDILKQYLSEEEIKQIVIDEYKSVIYNGIRSVSPDKRMRDFERIVSNAVYYYIQNEADKLIGESVANVISDKVKSVINKADYSTIVFRKKSDWETEDSEAQKLLKKAVVDSEMLIRSKVVEQINSIDIANIKDLIIESTVDYLKEAFKK